MTHRIIPSPVTAVQWWKHGDHPAVNAASIVHGWLSHGISTQTLVHPGDYIIDHPDGRVEHCPQGEFAGRFEEAKDILPLDEHTKHILGFMAMDCRPYAQMLRADGVDIPRKIEAEQATVLHWMLNYYLKHGANWREEAGKYVKAHLAALASPTAKGGGQRET